MAGNPIWFVLRHRGQPPRIFLRDDYMGLNHEVKAALDVAYKVMADFSGKDEEPLGLRAHLRLDGRRLATPRYKGMTYPLEKSGELLTRLKECLKNAGEKPEFIEIPGYFGQPPGEES